MALAAFGNNTSPFNSYDATTDSLVNGAGTANTNQYYTNVNTGQNPTTMNPGGTYSFTTPPTANTGQPTMTTTAQGQANWSTPANQPYYDPLGLGRTSANPTAAPTSNYAPLDFNNPSRYLYVNGKMEDRTDPNSNYYLSQWMYPNLTSNTGIQQMNVPYGAMNDRPNQITPGRAPNYGASGNVPQPAYGGSAPGTTTSQFNTTTPVQQQQQQGNNQQMMQLLQYLFGGASQPQYRSVKTPLGYTQYQGSVPQNSQGGLDPMSQLILQMFQGQNGGGGSQMNFSQLLGALASMGNKNPNQTPYQYNQSMGIPGDF